MSINLKSDKAIVTVRVKPEVKQEAKDILESSGVTLSDFIRMSLAKVVEEIDIRIVSKYTRSIRG